MEADLAIEKVQQNTAQRQQIETAYLQTCGAIAALYEFAPPEEGEEEAEKNASLVAQFVLDELVGT